MQMEINPKEIYLLSRYISPPHFLQLRDAWGTMLQHVERCLDKYMLHLPHDYRSRPLPQQPDAVWGELVLPNFRQTYIALCNGYIELLNGDEGGLGHAHCPMNDYKGQLEFSSDWMGSEDQVVYEELMNRALMFSRSIIATQHAHWKPGTLGANYKEQFLGPLDLPLHFPHYRLNNSVRQTTGIPIRTSGIYLPDVPNSCAQFLSRYEGETPGATTIVGQRDVLDGDGKVQGQQDAYETKACTWILIETESNNIEVKDAASTLLPETSHRVPGGDVS